LISLAEEADRASIHNGTAPPIPLLPEPDIADMEYFISQMQLVLPILGFNFLQAKPVIQPGATGVTADVSPIFTYSPSGASAKAQEINGEFVVFKGSTARVTGPQGWTSYRGLRDQLVLEKKLVPCDSPDFYVFAENVAFSSPTAGAVIVNACNISGRTGSWRVEGTSKTYQDWHEEKLAKAGGSSTGIE
jgi:hypothetical protein